MAKTKKGEEFSKGIAEIMREFDAAPRRGDLCWIPALGGWVDATARKRYLEAAQRAGQGSYLKPRKKPKQVAAGQGDLFVRQKSLW